MNRTRFKVTDCPKSIYFMDVQILQIMGRQMNRNPTPAFLSMRGTPKNGDANDYRTQHQLQFIGARYVKNRKPTVQEPNTSPIFITAGLP